jgi:glycosyltransferase involved in cell wall biosynthesis
VRALHLIAGNLWGGVESAFLTLARNRAVTPGVEVELATCFEGRLADEARAAGVPVHVLGAVSVRRIWTVLSARRALKALLRERRADVVLAHGAWPHALFAPVARAHGSALVFWAHDRAAGRHWVERWARRTPPDLVVANSAFTAASVPALFPAAPVEVCRCPVPAAPESVTGARARVRAALGTPADAGVIVMASRLERWKGHELLLDALAKVRAPGWVAWIAGGAQRPHEQVYLDGLRERARALGDRVRFLGARTDVPELLAAADVHCQPNVGPEPFGIAFVEALHAGLPVVTTAMGGALEIVDDEVGVLVPPDAGALANALDDLLARPDVRARLGGHGPARARALCDPRARLEQLEAALTGLRTPRRAAGVPA